MKQLIIYLKINSRRSSNLKHKSLSINRTFLFLIQVQSIATIRRRAYHDKEVILKTIYLMKKDKKLKKKKEVFSRCIILTITIAVIKTRKTSYNSYSTLRKK